MGQKSVSCREVGLRLQAYLDGELDDVRTEQIRAHLDDCAACGLEATAFIEIKESLRSETLPVDSSALARLREFSEQIATNAAAQG